jgi:hypothetical protein
MARSKSKHRRVQHKIRLKWKKQKERKADGHQGRGQEGVACPAGPAPRVPACLLVGGL